jgi:hypothetical protein
MLKLVIRRPTVCPSSSSLDSKDELLWLKTRLLPWYLVGVLIGANFDDDRDDEDVDGDG